MQGTLEELGQIVGEAIEIMTMQEQRISLQEQAIRNLINAGRTQQESIDTLRDALSKVTEIIEIHNNTLKMIHGAVSEGHSNVGS